MQARSLVAVGYAEMYCEALQAGVTLLQTRFDVRVATTGAARAPTSEVVPISKPTAPATPGVASGSEIPPTAGPIETDILLLGAGHAHVEVLRRFAM